MCAIHLAHSAGAERRNHVVISEATAGGQPERRGAVDIASVLDAARSSASKDSDATGHVRERRAGGVGREQRFDVPAQRFIARDRGRQECGAFGQRLFDSRFEQLFDTQPSIIGHTAVTTRLRARVRA